MAGANTQTALFFNLLLLLSLLFIVNLAESRSIPTGLTGGGPTTLQCASVYGVAAGETCFAVTQKFNLTSEVFASINPNLNCNVIFVGQWICVNGSVN
ncbi:hypothetical protein HS088_TW12G00277 [Tripterygium wilfordii]|uniref:LysM domain-containing protein n=1 Tax=Tripterygium wilfordii TaxID=458696 RepID=A0A7J7CYP3_TRIWF|nr:hypothetical protein HS088_TW12G00277 [Tripterygium wilfordii]